MKDIKFDLNDILITPDTISDIVSRYSDVDIHYQEEGFKHLPIIAAPMDTVVGKNQMDFWRNGIGLCIPRTSDERSMHFGKSTFPIYESYSLDEFIELIQSDDSVLPFYILIDIANGHMRKLYDTLDLFTKKKYFGSIKLMIGNIANPSTYRYISENYNWVYAVRIGIGNGNGCLTTQQTGVGYPMGSLISECSEIQQMYGGPLIVADGGMKSYSDVIKALALGAQYVMVGSIFNKALESAGETRIFGIKVDQHSKFAKWAFGAGLPIYKVFRGMSTKSVQKLFGGKVKTSEGITRKNKVEYTLEDWTENFKHYLASAMSYTNSKNLREFIGNSRYTVVTPESVSRYKK